MPLRDPDPTDPNMLVGVMLPADAEATRDMAYVFAEEFARLGYSREQLLGLFKNPFYGGAHGAYRTLGENETLAIIDECLNVWGNVKFSILDFGFSIGEDHRRDSNCGVNSEQDPNRNDIRTPTAEHLAESEQSKIQNRKSKIGEAGGCDE